MRSACYEMKPCERPPANRAFGTSAADAAQNAADVRDLLRTRLSMTDAEVDKVERFQPAGARATVEPKLQWLQARLDLDAAQLGKMILRLPPLLTKSVESMESNCDWLQRRLSLDDAGLRKIVLKFPQLLSFSVEDNMAPKLDWLRRRLDLDDTGLRKIVLTIPLLLSLSVDNNIAPKLDWLQTHLGLDEAGLRKMVLSLPSLLSSSVEDNLEPKLHWLQTRLDLDDEQLRKVVGCLSVLTISVETLESKLKWLQKRFNLDDAGLRKIVVSLPQLLSLSVEDNMEPTLDWLQTRLGLDAAQLQKVVLGRPSLLGYSVENNMAPKLEFLAREIGLTRDELRGWVVNNPTALSRSLEGCYRPRLEACRAAGVDVKRVLSYAKESDETLCKHTGIAPEDLAAIQESRTLNVNDFSAARVVPCETGGKNLVASGAFPAGAVLFRFAGELSPVNIGDRSLQVGRAAHLLSVPPEEPWVYLQHSFEPTVSLIVDPVTPVATARATEDLVDGAALTIDYTLHEWEMSGDGFVCSESGRRVRGFKHLTASEREAALPRAAPHIREMHLAGD